MPRDVLILAPTSDAHACAIAWALHQRGIDVLLTPSIPADAQARYAFEIDAEHEVLRGSSVRAGRFGAIWNRRLNDPEPTCADADRGFVGWEWRLFQRNLFQLDHAFGDALWVNGLAAAQRAEHKLVQLGCCRELGLPFPPTVVTNDAAEVDALRRAWGRIVFKSFLIHQWEDRQTGRKHAVGVPLLDQSSELPADAIAVCPGIYQRFIDKSCDVRVTVIGERMFAISLRRAAGGAFVDWRTHNAASGLVAEPIDLPLALTSQLRALMHRLGLVFGCIDLVRDTRGEYHFLEVNQAGQFLFVEDLVPEFPILAAMTDLLAEGRVDGARGTIARGEISLAAFRASDAFDALKKAVSMLPRDEAPRSELFSLE